MTQSPAVNEAAEAARQILCSLPEPLDVEFAEGILSLDCPEAEPLMVAKARSALDYESFQEWIAADGEIYFEAPQGDERKRYLKAYKTPPKVVPSAEQPAVMGRIQAMKLRQTVALVRSCADAARPGQLPMDDRRLAIMIERAGGYDSAVARAARRLCGMDAPEDDVEAQPDPLDSTRSAGSRSRSSGDSPPPSTGESS